MQQVFGFLSLLLLTTHSDFGIADDFSTEKKKPIDGIIVSSQEPATYCIYNSSELMCFGYGADGQTGRLVKIPNLRQVAPGPVHVCYLDQYGVRCFGNNSTGVLNVPHLKNPTQVVSGMGFSCALHDEGVKCWGEKGQQVTPKDLVNPRHITASDERVCAADDLGIRCGKPSYKTDEDQILYPAQNARHVSLNSNGSSICYIDDSGVKCRSGDSIYSSQVEKSPNFLNPIAPTEVLVTSKKTFSTSATAPVTCIIDGSDVRCVSYANLLERFELKNLKNPRNLSGNGFLVCVTTDEGVRCIPSRFKLPVSLNKPKYISAGGFRSCAIDQNGLNCWGMDSDLGLPAGISQPRSVALGLDHNCAIDRLGVFCWGRGNEYGQQMVPRGLVNPRQVAVGSALDASKAFSCALDKNGVQCWGAVPSGLIPAGLKKPSQIAAALGVLCVLDEGKVKCGGPKYSNNEVSVPADLQDVSQISVSSHMSCVITKGTVKCWSNLPGIFTVFPVPTGIKNPTQIAVGGIHACVIDDQGVKCWGDNSVNQLAVPASIVEPKQISAGGGHTCVLDRNGVKCWGGKRIYGESAIPETF